MSADLVDLLGNNKCTDKQKKRTWYTLIEQTFHLVQTVPHNLFTTCLDLEQKQNKTKTVAV